MSEVVTCKPSLLFDYTGWAIFNDSGKYLEKYERYKKMFQTKVAWYKGGLKMAPLI